MIIYNTDGILGIDSCPFCGSECNIENTTFGDSMFKYYRVRCTGEDEHAIDSWQDTPEEAIKFWNKRK